VPRRPPVETRAPTRISIVAIPEAMVSPISGLFETLKAAGSMAVPEDRDHAPADVFEIEIVGEHAGTIEGPSGLTINAQRAIGEVDQTDVVIVPSGRCTSAARQCAPPAPAGC
jgi:transcriptional regulator GlxA family with amidase domain